MLFVHVAPVTSTTNRSNTTHNDILKLLQSSDTRPERDPKTFHTGYIRTQSIPVPGPHSILRNKQSCPNQDSEWGERVVQKSWQAINQMSCQQSRLSSKSDQDLETCLVNVVWSDFVHQNTSNDNNDPGQLIEPSKCFFPVIHKDFFRKYGTSVLLFVRFFLIFSLLLEQTAQKIAKSKLRVNDWFRLTTPDFVILLMLCPRYFSHCTLLNDCPFPHWIVS